MTCSARLPVYALLISAFVPNQHYAWGLLSLRGLVLLGLYLLGILAGVITRTAAEEDLTQGTDTDFSDGTSTFP